MVIQQKQMKKFAISTTVAAGLFFAVPQATDAALGDQTLRFGMNHPDVKELQEVLRNKGYFTFHTSTGFYGTITRDAVIRYQRDNNIVQSGIVGPLTLEALLSPTSTNRADTSTQISNAATSSSTTNAVAATPSSTSQILRFGSQGQAVTDLQNQLREVGLFNQEATGFYGRVTTAAVQNFQRRHGLTVDGIAGPQTFRKLNEVTTRQPSQPSQSNNNTNTQPRQQEPASNTNAAPTNGALAVGSRGQAVTQLQSQLRNAGFFTHSLTEFFGPITETALRNFQRSQGLSVTGIADSQTVAALNNIQPAANPVSTSIQVTNLIADASGLLGVPYLWGGTTPAGFDCSGLIRYLFTKQGISIPRTVAQQWQASTPVSRPQVGDLVFFETISPGPSHNGIYIGNGQFIHSGSSTGVTISNLSNSYWGPRYLGARSLF